MNCYHSSHRHHDQRPSPTLTDCQQKAAASEQTDPARRSVLSPFPLKALSERCFLFFFYNSHNEYGHLKSYRKENNKAKNSVCTFVVTWCNMSLCPTDRSTSPWISLPHCYAQQHNCVYLLCRLWQVLVTIFSPISMRHTEDGRACSSSLNVRWKIKPIYC